MRDGGSTQLHCWLGFTIRLFLDYNQLQNPKCLLQVYEKVLEIINDCLNLIDVKCCSHLLQCVEHLFFLC